MLKPDIAISLMCQMLGNSGKQCLNLGVEVQHLGGTWVLDTTAALLSQVGAQVPLLKTSMGYRTKLLEKSSQKPFLPAAYLSLLVLNSQLTW